MDTTLKSLTPQEVVAAYEKYKAELHRGGSMATANWPTALAHQCPAYAYWNRTVPPDQRRAISPELAMLFDEGNEHERLVRHALENAGFEITENQGQLVWPKFQISGRKDFNIWKEGFAERIHCDLKTAGDYTFNKLNTAEDCLDSDWFGSWYRQISLYMWLAGVKEYWIILKSKNRGKLKIIPFKMDEKTEAAAEEMLKKAEWVNKLIQIGEMPKQADKISEAEFCSECQFFDVCLPDLTFGPGAVIFDDQSIAELVAQLDRRAELRAAYKEYEALDEELKDEMKMHASEGITKMVIGPWVVDVKERSRKGYSVGPTSWKEFKFIKP